jgi:hypothetical protein
LNLPSDIVGCQSSQECSDLQQWLDEQRFSPEEFNERIHQWMPGVKSVFPPDYFRSVDAALLTVPSTTCGRYLINVDETREMGCVWYSITLRHPTVADRNVTAIYEYLPYAIVMASLSARIQSLHIAAS